MHTDFPRRWGHRQHTEPGAFGRHGGPSQGPGHGFGPHGQGRRGRGQGRGRAQRGDVRTAALLLLADTPMHGYQLMQAIADRTEGAWRPSPGAIYPTLNQLQDEGLVTMTTDGGRKLATLTEAGREYLSEHGDELGDPFGEFAASASGHHELRVAIEEIIAATRQVGRRGSETQLAAASKVLAEARRSLYLILAEDPTALGQDES